MSEQLQIGDRARVVFNKEGRIWGGEGYLYENTSQILGAEGVVTTIHGDEITLMETRTTRLVIAAECLTRVETQRRTFEEIVKELAEKPEFKGIWNADFEYAERTVLLTNKRGFMLHIYDDGEVRFEADIENGSHTIIFSAPQLSAISAACSEIAANYKAEHGKEQQQ